MSQIHNDISDSRSLFVVGDDAQSIYAFRGSNIEIILNFHRVYKNTQEIILNQNYRSTQNILDLAEKVLTHNPRQKKKSLFTENPDSVEVLYYLARNERDEAEYIIRQLIAQYGMPGGEQKPQIVERDDEFSIEYEQDQSSGLDAIFDVDSDARGSSMNDPVSAMFDVYLDDAQLKPPSFSSVFNPNSWQAPRIDWKNVPELESCVILYRTHSQSRAIEETFLKQGVPYKLVSGVRFLDRKEIKDVLAMLKFLANGTDMISLRRFLPLVLEGVGPKTMDKIIAYLQDWNYPLAPKHQHMMNELLSKIQGCWNANSSLIDLTKDLLVSSGYVRYLKGEYPVKEEFDQRMENISELYSVMFPFDEDASLPLQDRLSNFLMQVSLMTTQEANDVDDIPRISLMSLHQSKGLEYETVFLIGVEDGLLPHQNSFMEPDGMEEEVRLAYVGVTRAKKHLHLISADSRVQFGQIKANPLSRIFRPFMDTYVKRMR